MKLASLVLPCALLLSACSTANQPEAPKPPVVCIANPASVYCDEKGGTRIIVKEAAGERADCKLPTGEILDEWDLWRRDHQSSVNE